MSFQRIGYRWADIDEDSVVEDIGSALFASAIHPVNVYKRVDSLGILRVAKAGEVVELEGKIVRRQGFTMVPLRGGGWVQREFLVVAEVSNAMTPLGGRTRHRARKPEMMQPKPSAPLPDVAQVRFFERSVIAPSHPNTRESTITVSFSHLECMSVVCLI